jgi:RNA polymerase sigma factor (sigma-70 family)
VTEQQTLLFEKYQHLVPEKIAKYAPDYVYDEDLSQEVYLGLIVFLCGNSFSPYIGTSWECWQISTRLERIISQYLRKQEKSEEIMVLELSECDVVEDPICKNVAYDCVSDAVERALGFLTESESTVLKMRFGMYDGQEHTLEEVGQILGWSRMKVRRLENMAINKLKAHRRIKILKDCYCI